MIKYVLFAMYMTTTGPVDSLDPTKKEQQWDLQRDCSTQLVDESEKLQARKEIRYLVCQPIDVADIPAIREKHARNFHRSVTF